VELRLPDALAERAAVAAGLAEAVEREELPEPVHGAEEIRGRTVVVGVGPAGLFAALRLARAGCRPLLIERGAPVEDRHRDVSAFLQRRELDPDSNFLFGAGGAGTYSDGKLFTRVHDPRVRRIMADLVAMGGDPRLLVDARPHVGTDRLGGIVTRLCAEIVRLGERSRGIPGFRRWSWTPAG